MLYYWNAEYDQMIHQNIKLVMLKSVPESEIMAGLRIFTMLMIKYFQILIRPANLESLVIWGEMSKYSFSVDCVK